MSALSKVDDIINVFHKTNLNGDEKTNDNETEEKSTHESLSISCKQIQLPGWAYSFDVSNILYSKKSKFQDIKIVETPMFDRCLLMDGQIQSSVKDEFIYHESLVHPAMLAHPNPVNVFIGGGGECATAREVLKYPSVKNLIICDLDQDVIDVSKKYLPSMFCNIDNDKRCKIIIEDAKKYIENYDGVFDIIIMDICDPIEAGPGIVCYFKEFYQNAMKKLSPNGIFVTQSTACDLMLYHECFTVIVNTLKNTFNQILPYSGYVPSFYAQWGFCLGFKNISPKWFNDKNKINEMLKNKLGQKQFDKLKYYDGETHLRMFNLPKYLRTAIDHENRVMTKQTPYYQY